MPEQTLFDYGFELLEKRYPNEVLHKDIKVIYLQHFKENLTDVEFLEAVKYMVLHSRFMPTAGDLVAHIHGSKEAKGVQEWADIIKAAPRSDAKECLAYLSDRAQIALKSVGGLHAIGLADTFDLKRMEKSFLTVYCQCSTSDRKSLAQAPVEAPVEVENERQEPVPMPDYIREQIKGVGAKFASSKKKEEAKEGALTKFAEGIA